MGAKPTRTATKDAPIILPDFTEKPSPADLLPDFREAIPTPDKLDTSGCKALAAAIIARAAYDYYDVCLQPDTGYPELATNQNMPASMYCDKGVLEHFIDSKWFDCLTNIPPKAFREIIKERRRHGAGMSAEGMKTLKREKKPAKDTVNPKELSDAFHRKTTACKTFVANRTGFRGVPGYKKYEFMEV